MKTLKIATTIGITVLIGILILLSTARSPLDQQYEQTLALLMEAEGYISEAEAMQYHPELAEAKAHMAKADQWEQEVRRMSASPNSLAGEASREWIRRMALVRKWRQSARQLLREIASGQEAVAANI